MALSGNRSYSASAAATVGFYVYANGTWNRIGGQQVYFYGSGYTSGGTKTLYSGVQIPASYGGDFSDFRVVVESLDEGNSVNLNSVPDCTWTSQTTSGQRSATPNGEKVTATMRPS